MTALFKNLNHKDQPTILVLDAPESCERELAALKGPKIARKRGETRTMPFFLAFTKTQRELGRAIDVASSKAEGDAIVWIAYPKKSSTRYTCDRDRGWEGMGEAGFDPVRMVAIDEDWSALRFRRVEFIKKMTRDPKRRLTGR